MNYSVKVRRVIENGKPLKAIATDTWDNCVGYRFSLVDKTGANKVTKVIDVIRDSHFGRHVLYAADRFTVQRNKKQLIALQNSGFRTSHTYVNCYKEQDYAFATSLPDPSGMGTWQNNTTNLNVVLSLLGAGNIYSLKNGDKILVEPIFDVRLESVYHAVTVTEIALYGKHILGSESDGGSSSQSESWGFISNFVNKHYPNALFNQINILSSPRFSAPVKHPENACLRGTGKAIARYSRGYSFLLPRL